MVTAEVQPSEASTVSRHAMTEQRWKTENGLASAYIRCLLVRFEQWHNLGRVQNCVVVTIERTRLGPYFGNRRP